MPTNTMMVLEPGRLQYPHSLWTSLGFVVLLVLSGCIGGRSVQQHQQDRYSVLVFSERGGRADNVTSSALQSLRRLEDTRTFSLDVVESASGFSTDLSQYDAVLFLHTDGTVLEEAQREALQNFIRQGGGFVSLGAAAVGDSSWEWYNKLVGARVVSRAPASEAEVQVSDGVHPATRELPARWRRSEAWASYEFDAPVHVMAVVEGASADAGAERIPVIWAHDFEGGRALHAGLGTTEESYTDPRLTRFLIGSMRWAAGVESGDAGATLTRNYEKVVLDSTATRPNELKVAPDGRVFYIEREGAVKVWSPETQSTEMVGFIPVKAVHTSGLIGMTLDPNFSENGWMYVYYSPRGDDTRNELARFTISNNKLIPASKRVILNVPTKRNIQQAHSAGSLAFGPDGNLFLSVGDNANPLEVELSTPIDERPGREDWDAQRTSGNTMSLRGKILRIRPREEGGYDIPQGNLFPYGSVGRPEIYAMGMRNPFRIAVDPETGWLYWGEYGHGGGETEKRGPAGHDEFNRATEPGFFGWPYFIADNKPFRDYDFATGDSGDYYDPERPINDSPNNTGARQLPPTQPAMIWYSHPPSTEFPQLGAGGLGAMAGAVYRYDEEIGYVKKLPPYYDGSFLIMEFMRHWIKEVKFDDSGNLLHIRPFLPEMDFRRPFDMDIGPDGAIYLIEWGSGYEGWFNDDAQIVRIDYHGTEERPPVAAIHVDRTSGAAPLDVTFSAGEAAETEGMEYAWDVDSDGIVDSRSPRLSHTYEEPGTYTATLVVTDEEGRSSSDELAISAGNTAPRVAIEWPLHGGIVDFGTPVRYRATVTDTEDAVEEGRVTAQLHLVHDSHSHQAAASSGSDGIFTIRQDESHLYLEDSYAKLEVSYTDDGRRGVDSLTTKEHVVLQPRRMPAVHVDEVQGARRIAEGVRFRENVQSYLEVTDSDYVSYAPVNLRNIDSITFAVSPQAEGAIEIRTDAPDGPLVGRIQLDTQRETAEQDSRAEPGREDTDPWTELTMPVTDPGGTQELYLVYSGPSDSDPVRIAWLEFNGAGMMTR